MNDNQYFNSIDQAPESPAPVASEKNAWRGIFMVGMLAGVALTLLVAGVCYLGVRMQNAEKKVVVKDKKTQTEVTTDSDEELLDSATINKLKSLLSTIDKYYYLEKVDNDTLRNGMYKGLMDALGDPYTEYYTAQELNDMLDSTEGVYYGIGAYVSKDDTGYPKINGIIKNSPAEDAKLRANDIIYEVDGESTYGLTLNEAVSLIKGPEGTNVVLTIVREGETSTLKITLTRRKVETPTVEYEMLEDGMAKIQVTEFDDVTVDQFAEALAQAKTEEAKGLILDLRANPGGNLSSVVKMCQMILPEGLIVYTEDKAGKRTEYKCDGKNELDIPLVVLVDNNSASAAEIMSGAIKDYGIGTLVGTTTFGKGIVQQIVPYRDGTAVKITISAYYTPSGKNIHGIGIEPDVECEFDSKAYYDEENPVDNQLEKAKEVLREKMK